MRSKLLRLTCWLTATLTFIPHGFGQDVDSVVTLLEFVIDVDEETAAKCLTTLTERVQSGEVRGQRLAEIRGQLGARLQPVRQGGPASPLYHPATFLAAAWGDDAARTDARQLATDPQQSAAIRHAAIDALVAGQDPQLLLQAAELLRQDPRLAEHLLAALGRYEAPLVARSVLEVYGDLPDELQPKAIELLTQRTAWSKLLLQAIGAGSVDRSALNINQVRKLLAGRDPELTELVRQEWGEVRTERNPEREQLILAMQQQLSEATGDAERGQGVFNKVCGQCHKIHGQGQDVGPEITRNGRGSFSQLLSNVFDPSLVIGAAYQARTVVTADGRVLTGLLTEDSPQRIVLKTQGGKLEIIPRGEVDELLVSQLSLMPEGLEKQLPPQELADLFAFLILDGPPDQRPRQVIDGAPANLVAD